MMFRKNKYLYLFILGLSGIFFLFLTSGEGKERINPRLAEELKDLQPGEKTSVIVLMKEQADLDAFVDFYPSQERREAVIQKLQEVAAFTQKPLLAELALKPEVEITHTYWIFNGFVLRATKAAILEIAARADVAEVSLDGVFSLPPITFQDYIPPTDAANVTWNIKKINAHKVWKIFGNKGEGICIAVIDTGVNEHNDLEGRIVDGKNYIESGKPPRDDHGHGTLVAGIIAGNGAAGTATGVAPESTILNIKILNSDMQGSWSNLYLAIEEAIEKKARIANLCLGGFPDQATRDRLRLACKNAIASGVIPVIAAGNAGESGVNSPGDVPEVITSGATKKNDEIVDVSGRGPVKWGNKEYIKPDITAPGVEVTSCAYDSLDTYKLAIGYATSMANPHIVGVAALMLNANPSLDTLKVKQIMEKTAIDLGDEGKDNVYGSGRIRAFRAVIGAHFYK